MESKGEYLGHSPSTPPSYTQSLEQQREPSQQFDALPQKYGAPGQQYGAPGQQYGAPGQQYGAQYGAPGQQYGAPGQQYGAQYGAPGQQYGAAGQQYGAQYGAPGQQYGVRSPYTVQPQYGQSSSSNVVIQTAMVVPPPRESGPAPDPTCGLVLAILSFFFCIGGWPFAVASIIFNRKGKQLIREFQYTSARGQLKISYILLGVAILVGIIAWVIFAVRLKYALDLINDDRYYYGK